MVMALAVNIMMKLSSKFGRPLDGEVVYENGDNEWGEYSSDDATQVRGGNVQVHQCKAGKS
jgi:hypothetical protein